MPEAAQLAIAVSAAAPIFRMRSFTLAEFEEALVYPQGNELLNIILSRWLIRDHKVRWCFVVAQGGEGGGEAIFS